jgi:hypothetical protein
MTTPAIYGSTMVRPIVITGNDHTCHYSGTVVFPIDHDIEAPHSQTLTTFTELGLHLAIDVCRQMFDYTYGAWSMSDYGCSQT